MLRGIASLAVVCLHAMHRPQWEESGSRLLAVLEQILERGGLGVPLFFVISGFCIHLRWAKDTSAGRPARVDFLAFWRRRLWRLYPAYLVALLTAVGLLILRVSWGLANPYPGDFWGWLAKDVLAHVFMLHGLHPDLDYQGGNVVFWTLAREEYLYLLYFPLLALRSRMPMTRVCVLVGLAGLLLPWLVLSAIPEPREGLLALLSYTFNDHSSAVALWIQWVLGAVAVEAYLGLTVLPVWTRSWLAVGAWALLAEILTAWGLAPLVPVAWGLCFFTIVNASIRLEAGAGTGRSAITSLLALTGRFSYSLYLIHLPALVVLQKAELLARDLLGIQDLSTNAPYLFGCWLVFVAGGWVAGWLFFQAVERHFLPNPQ